MFSNENFVRLKMILFSIYNSIKHERISFFFRIARALKESENYSQGITNNGNTSRNRKTVVRMQS